jgi:hypothetical protein
MANKLVVIGEEIDVAHNRALAAGLKELITGERVQINAKHVAEIERPNRTNFIFISKAWSRCISTHMIEDITSCMR